MTDTVFRVLCLGRGNVGRTLASAWRAAEMSVQLREGRGAYVKPKVADAIVLAVPDRAIEEVAERIAARGAPCPVLHVAGARGVEALAALKEVGIPVGVMHPLLSIPRPLPAAELVDASMVVTGDDAAVRAATCLAVGAGMKPVRARKLDAGRYHLGASLLANGAVALAWRAEQLLVDAGIDKGQAASMLGALLMSVARNLQAGGPAAALSGPVRRGDMRTVQQHLDLLRDADPETRTVYEALTALQLSLVGAAKTSPNQLEDLVLQHLLAADASTPR